MNRYFTAKELTAIFKLTTPLRWMRVTQPFGVNYADFYKELGMLGHNGHDLRADAGTPVFAAHNGMITWAGEKDGYGIHIRILSDPLWIDGIVVRIETVYGHLKVSFVKQHTFISAETVIGETDNTGKYTTADHLHFGVRPVYELYKDDIHQNGYAGYVDPTAMYQDKGWDLLPVEKRYYKFYKDSDPKWRPWHAFMNEKKVAYNLTKKLKRLPSAIQIQACTYGAWGWEDVANPALFPVWATQTRQNFLDKKPVPIRLTA